MAELFSPEKLLETLIQLIKEVGVVKGILVFVLVLLFLFFQYRISYLYRQNIEGKQKEIDRIAADNREYREMFMKMLKQSERKTKGK